MLDLVFFITFMVLGFTIGTILEKRHFKSIRERELKLIDKIATSSKFPINPNLAKNARLVSGSVVVSSDFFKNFCAYIINIFGGKISVFESLLDRGRREAILRLKESCLDADEIINLRIETSSISKNTNKVTCVEVLAYGTAIYYDKV